MANTLVLKSRAIPTTYHHNQVHVSICSSPQTLFLQHPPYKTQAASTTLLQKPYNNNTNPTILLSSKKPFFLNHETNPKLDHNYNDEQGKTSLKNPIGLILDAITSAIKCLRKPAAGVVLACLLMIIHDRRYPAWAASVGRMGGRSSSSRSSRSSGSSRSSSRSSSSYRRSYSSSSSSSRGGDEVEAKPWTEEDTKGLWAFFGFFAALLSVTGGIFLLCDDWQVTAQERNSIIKLQIGLLGTAKSLQSELNQIALTADTSTSLGISDVSRGTTSALLRHSDYFMSAYSSVTTKRRIADGEKFFNKLSLEERAKFDEETLVNVDNVKKHIKRNAETTGITSDFIVVTLLMDVKGVLKLPTIKGSVNLKEALQKLESIPFYETIAAEVLWTPQAENDTLSEEDLTKDYPLLKPLEDDLQT